MKAWERLSKEDGCSGDPGSVVVNYDDGTAQTERDRDRGENDNDRG